jgi:hypothetical protein
MGENRYVVQHFDSADGGRSWHVYDTKERNHIHTATHGFLSEDKSEPECCTRICIALNAIEDVSMTACCHCIGLNGDHMYANGWKFCPHCGRYLLLKNLKSDAFTPRTFRDWYAFYGGEEMGISIEKASLIWDAAVKSVR